MWKKSKIILFIVSITIVLSSVTFFIIYKNQPCERIIGSWKIEDYLGYDEFIWTFYRNNTVHEVWLDSDYLNLSRWIRYRLENNEFCYLAKSGDNDNCLTTYGYSFSDNDKKLIVTRADTQVQTVLSKI